jgi:hypothetical protein
VRVRPRIRWSDESVMPADSTGAAHCNDRGFRHAPLAAWNMLHQLRGQTEGALPGFLLQGSRHKVAHCRRFVAAKGRLCSVSNQPLDQPKFCAPSSSRLRLYSLHHTGPAADRLPDPNDPNALSEQFPNSRLLVRGRSSLTPDALQASPARTRSRIRDRSNSANTPAT